MRAAQQNAHLAQHRVRTCAAIHRKRSTLVAFVADDDLFGLCLACKFGRPASSIEDE
jgi:hypothetical protein